MPDRGCVPATPRTVTEALATARAAGVHRLDAQLLVAHHLGRPRAWVIAHGEAELPQASVDALLRDLQQRADDVPLAYLLGRHEFHGLMLDVTPAVLDPRPDTETLVEAALELLPSDRDATVIDLGTGSGAVALALKHARPRATLHASDASAAALAVAAANAQRLGLPILCHHGDWWHALPAGVRADMVVSNPPYLASDDPHLPALRHEPHAALVGGANGLEAIRHIIDGAAAHLLPGGWLLLEHGDGQEAAIDALLEAAGFEARRGWRDLAGHLRCSGGRRPHAEADKRLAV